MTDPTRPHIGGDVTGRSIRHHHRHRSGAGQAAHKGNIGRPVLDQLRGSLPYHKAIRGTLITLGNFSKGCTEAALYPGAAPITLINGEKLLDMLIEHEIGIRKRPAQLYELDEDFFKADDQPEPLDLEQ